MAVTEIVHWRLKKPAHVTVVLWENRLYVFYDDIPIGDGLRGDELEEVAWEAKQAGILVERYEVDDEYKRLWLEMPCQGPCQGCLVGETRRQWRCLGTWAGC